MSSSLPGDTLAKMQPDAYGCVVANRFGELLDDDADPFDMIRAVEKDTKKKQEDERKGKQKKPGQKESQKDRRVPRAPGLQEPAPVQKQQQQQQQPQQQQARPGPVAETREEAQRGMKRGVAGERRASQEERPEYSIEKPSSYADSDLRGRGGPRGRRGARGGGYTRNPDNFNLRGKREYDRHNGTGISPEEKRGGRGPWNWGCAEEATSELMEVSSDAPVKAEEAQMTVDENPNPATEEEDGEMVVHVAMEMTLDEWKAMQEISRPKVEFNIRKTENQIPSKAKVIHQSKHLENLKSPPVEEIEDEGNFLRRSVNDITSLLDINFGSLGRPCRGGRGRGARGGMTNRPERPKPILEKEDDLAPNPDDPEDFPALPTGR